MVVSISATFSPAALRNPHLRGRIADIAAADSLQIINCSNKANWYWFHFFPKNFLLDLLNKWDMGKLMKLYWAYTPTQERCSHENQLYIEEQWNKDATMNKNKSRDE